MAPVQIGLDPQANPLRRLQVVKTNLGPCPPPLGVTFTSAEDGAGGAGLAYGPSASQWHSVTPRPVSLPMRPAASPFPQQPRRGPWVFVPFVLRVLRRLRVFVVQAFVVQLFVVQTSPVVDAPPSATYTTHSAGAPVEPLAFRPFLALRKRS